MARSQLFGLLNVMIRRTETLGNPVAAEADNYYRVVCSRRLRAPQYMGHHRYAADFVQHFRLSRFHARAFACGQNRRHKFTHSFPPPVPTEGEF